MKFWIEVASGNYSWTRKTELSPATRLGLKAPASTRYKNLFEKISPGDIVLTHLTSRLTRNKKWQRSIVGVSTVAGESYAIGSSIYMQLDRSHEFKVPIRFSEYRYNIYFSDDFKKAISFFLQKYLLEISKNDFLILIKLHKENEEDLLRSEYGSIIKEIDI